jgi:hypothetical protein
MKNQHFQPQGQAQGAAPTKSTISTLSTTSTLTFKP